MGLFSFLAPVVGVVGGLLGFRSTQRKIEGAAGGIQASIDTTLKDVHKELALFREKLEADLLPEATQTMAVVRESMQDVVGIMYKTSLVAQESMKEMVILSHAFLNRTFVTMDRVDDVLIQVKYGMEIGLIMLFLFIAILCGYELRKATNEQTPSVYALFERDILRMLRIGCILACLALMAKVFTALVLNKTAAAPEEILPWVFLPVVLVIFLNIFRLLLRVILFISPFLQFIWWYPYNIVVYPCAWLFYKAFLQPTAWLVRVYQNRRHFRNQFGIYLILCLVLVLLPVILILTFECITTVMGDSLKLDTGLLLAIFITYIIYYVLAFVIMVRYTIQTVGQQVKKVYELRYRENRWNRLTM